MVAWERGHLARTCPHIVEWARSWAGWKPALPGLLFLLASPAVAEVPLSGALEQGGLAVGQARPGAQVSLENRRVSVDEAGRFVLGFGRDAPARLRLVVDGVEQTVAIQPRDWPVQRIDGLPPAKVTPDAKALERIRAETKLIAERRDRDSPASWYLGGFAQPADGVVSGVFGSQRILNGEPRAPHSGTDIAAPAGAAVRAAADGVISLAHRDLYFTGMTVMIDHGHGLSSVYAHLSAITVKEGQTVRRSQDIGRVGATGRATGPHLHWGVSWFDQKLDPETVLKTLSASEPGRSRPTP
jgi:murein DD-endopeptidase MepM/ murein hydrolase activator NlpD